MSRQWHSSRQYLRNKERKQKDKKNEKLRGSDYNSCNNHEKLEKNNFVHFLFFFPVLDVFWYRKHSVYVKLLDPLLTLFNPFALA